MLKLLSVELLKIRRSLALLMMFLIPLFVVVLNALIMLKRFGIERIGPDAWKGFWLGNTALWCYFMLPLFIALITGLLNGQEHKNQTWRLMLTLPVSRFKLYAVKAVLAWLFVAGASAVLLGGAALAAALLGMAGADTATAFDYPLLAPIVKVTLACVPVLMIQHAVSWRYNNLVLPLAVGVIATMGITQIGSSEYWVCYPWSYALMALNGSTAAMQQQALVLGAAVGLALFALTSTLLGRRETEA